LAPCDFFLFPKLKLKLKGRRFDTIEEIQAESQRVLDTLTEKTSRKRSKNGGDGGTGVYMREGTTSRVTAADRPYGEFYDFYSVSPENFGSNLIHVHNRSVLFSKESTLDGFLELKGLSNNNKYIHVVQVKLIRLP